MENSNRLYPTKELRETRKHFVDGMINTLGKAAEEIDVEANPLELFIVSRKINGLELEIQILRLIDELEAHVRQDELFTKVQKKFGEK